MCHGFVFLKLLFFSFSLTWWPFTLLYVQVLFSFYLDFIDHMNYCLDDFFYDCDKLPRTNWTANSKAVVCQKNTCAWSWAEKKKQSITFKGTDVIKEGRAVPAGSLFQQLQTENIQSSRCQFDNKLSIQSGDL